MTAAQPLPQALAAEPRESLIDLRGNQSDAQREWRGKIGDTSGLALSCTPFMHQPPSLRFLMAHPAHFIALGCGSGLSMWAPGSVGTLFAWLSFELMRPQLADGPFLALLALAFALGVSAIQKAGAALGEVDHGSIVWDEIVPFWFVLLLTPATFAWQLAAFALFRLFDILKPQPARWFDTHMKNGLGVMLDDVVAAGYTLFCIAVLKWLLG